MIAAQRIEGPAGDTGAILETIMEDVTPSTTSVPSEEEGRALECTLDCTKSGLPDISLADLPRLGVTVKDLALPGSLLVATGTATVLSDTQVYGSTEAAINAPPATSNRSPGTKSSDEISTPSQHHTPAQDDEARDREVKIIGFTDTAPDGNKVEQATSSPAASTQSLRSVISECRISASEYPYARENALADFDYDTEGSNGNPHNLPVQDDEIRVIGFVDAAPGGSGNGGGGRHSLPKFEWGVGPAPGERGCVKKSSKELGFLKKLFSRKAAAIGHPPSLGITPKTKAKEQMDITHAEGIVAKIIDIKKKLTGKSTNMATGSKL